MTKAKKEPRKEFDVVAQTLMIPVALLDENKGQIEGVPKNPRVIKGKRFKQLCESLKEDPELMNLRPLLVYPRGDRYVVIDGNMRVKALRDMAHVVAPCEVLQEGTTPEQMKRYIAKTNSAFGDWDWDALANEWDCDPLDDWGIDLPEDWGEQESEGANDEDEIERKRQEFKERMANGEDMTDDEEYLEFLAKFEAKKTTDDCYTPEIVYNAVARWVSDEYGVKQKDFERPFYPGGDYKKHVYPKGCVVVDNPPFSILAEILQFYKENGVRFFLFAPTLTLFSSSSSSSTALPIGVQITYENGANVNTSFLTNLEPKTLRLRSVPSLYRIIQEANDENLKNMHKNLPNYAFPDEVVTSTRIAYYSKYGVEFSVNVDESEPCAALDAMKSVKKTIFGKGYLISEKAAAEKAAAEKAAAEKAAAHKWELSDRERAIVKKLGTK